MLRYASCSIHCIKTKCVAVLGTTVFPYYSSSEFSYFYEEQNILNKMVLYIYFIALAQAQAELIKMYTDVTKSVDVLPFRDQSPGLPIASIFAPLLMEEDLKSKGKMWNPENQGGKELKSLKEVFYTADKPANRIFMKGEAGCGKTFFCLKLLDTWCQVKQTGTVTNDMLQQCLAVFDLVFYLPLRHFKGNLTSVKDMIGQTVSAKCLELVSDGRIHCLVILDGLDESPVTFRELPSMHGIVNNVLFCTTRPWKLIRLSLMYSHGDKVVQILGLLPTCEKKVIEYVLVNFYKLKKETEEFKKKFKRYSSMLNISSLESLLKIPMMLTACCCLWYEEDAYIEQSNDRKGQVTIDYPTVRTSMTHTYLSLVDSMIRRADQKCDLESLLTLAGPLPLTNIPKVLQSFSYIHSFIGVLLPLCRLAYTALVSSETKLVFQKDELEREIGHTLVDIALKVGLISQTKAPGRFHQQNISVNFYHKSVQEFLAAIHLTCTDTDDIRSYCTSLDKVMNVANIIMFGITLNPSFCHDVSKHVMDTVNTDADIKQYRQTLDDEDNDEVVQLCRTQYQWYRELTHSRTLTGDTSPLPTLHVTDIYLHEYSDSDSVRLTGELICTNLHTIVSVWLGEVDPPLHRVLQCLPQCPNLVSLCIRYMSQIENHAQMVAMIPRLTQLDILRYGGGRTEDAVEKDSAVVAAVLQLTQLSFMQLEWVDLRDNDGLVLTADWTHLKTIVLRSVYMTDWERFVSSLLTVLHPVQVTIVGTDLNILWMIQDSPHFTGGEFDESKNTKPFTHYNITFTTVPPTVTQDDGRRTAVSGSSHNDSCCKCCIM